MPTKVDYGGTVERPPAKRQKRSGPVRLVLPALNTKEEVTVSQTRPSYNIVILTQDEEDDSTADQERLRPSQTGSGLFSLLPAPKNSFAQRKSRPGLPSAAPIQTSTQNLKPQGKQ